MRASRQSWTLAVAALVLLLANGCARNEEQPDTSPANPEPVTLEESPDAAATRESEASPAEQCLKMALQEDWGAALDPCTRAARDHPDDESIQQALERAMDAADQAIE